MVSPLFLLIQRKGEVKKKRERQTYQQLYEHLQVTRDPDSPGRKNSESYLRSFVVSNPHSDRI
jgi:hypothetical protein